MTTVYNTCLTEPKNIIIVQFGKGYSVWNLNEVGINKMNQRRIADNSTTEFTLFSSMPHERGAGKSLVKQGSINKTETCQKSLVNILALFM